MSSAVALSAASVDAQQQQEAQGAITIKQRIQRWFTRRSYPDSQPFSVENLEMIESIGEGSFATVARAQDRITRIDYAIKMINLLNFPEPEARAQIEQEQKIMELINGHPLIVRLFHTWEVHDNKCFALEFVAGGDLFEILKKERRFSLNRSARYVLQLGKALDYLHSKNVIFRDLKLENILLDNKSDQIRLADFGLAKIVPNGQQTRTVCGTVQYMAPEIILNQPYDSRVDWWSLGVITYVFIAGKYPFNKGHGQIQNDRSEQDRMIMYKRILDGQIEFPSDTTAVAADVIRELLHADPGLRLHGIESLEMQEWFVAENLTPAPIARHKSQDFSVDINHESHSASPSKSASIVSHTHSQEASDELNCMNFAQNFILNHIDDPSDQPTRLSGSIQMIDQKRSRSPRTAIVKSASEQTLSDAITAHSNSESGVLTNGGSDDNMTRPKSSDSLEHAVSFFTLLERIQGSRMDNQRSAHSGAAVTMPFRDFDTLPTPGPAPPTSSRFNIFKRRAKTAKAPNLPSTSEHTPPESLSNTPATASVMDASAQRPSPKPSRPSTNESASNLLAFKLSDTDTTVDLLSEIPELKDPPPQEPVATPPSVPTVVEPTDQSNAADRPSNVTSNTPTSPARTDKSIPRLRMRDSLTSARFDPNGAAVPRLPPRVSMSKTPRLPGTPNKSSALATSSSLSNNTSSASPTDGEEEGLSRSGSVLRGTVKANVLTTFGPTIVNTLINSNGDLVDSTTSTHSARSVAAASLAELSDTTSDRGISSDSHGSDSLPSENSQKSSLPDKKPSATSTLTPSMPSKQASSPHDLSPINISLSTFDHDTMMQSPYFVHMKPDAPTISSQVVPLSSEDSHKTFV